jgi:NitT/TauT family transport system substrate-binding protein
LDVAVTALALAQLAAADRGLDLTIGAGVDQLRPGWESAWIVLRKDLADSGKVKTAADLKGMKVAIHAVAHMSELSMGMFLEQGGVKPGEVEVVILPSSEQLAAFQNKAIAASTSTAVIVATGVQQGLFTKWVPYAQSFGGTLQGSVMLYSPAFAKDQDLGRRWMIAYLKGVRDYMKAFTTKEGRQEVVEILTKHTSLKDPKQYDVIGMSYIEPNGGLHMESLDRLDKLWAEKGQYTGKKRFRDLVDLSHADYAVQKLGMQ